VGLAAEVEVTAREKQEAAVGRPVAEHLAGGMMGDAVRHAAGDRDRVYIAAAVVVTDECDGLTVGAEAGESLGAGGLASGVASPPARSTIQRSFAYEKTMCVALTSG
jgi:hypothetical protein